MAGGLKKSKAAKNPKLQLLAELIAAIELNSFATIKGAFIIGAIWNFVILEKLESKPIRFGREQITDCQI